jgi:hypothetical protein
VKLVEGPDGRWLECGEGRFRLEGADWLHMRKRTPLGRKVWFRHRAKELSRQPGCAEDSALLLAWSGLPAREWDIPIA